MPQPEGPTIATASPASRVRERPEKSSRRASPSPNPRASDSATRSASPGTERLRDVDPRGHSGRYERGKERPGEGEHPYREEVPRAGLEGNVREREELGRKRDGVGRVEDDGQEHSQQEARERADGPEEEADEEKDAGEDARGGAEDRQDGRVSSTRRRQDRRGRREIQARDDDDEEDGGEDGDPLEPESEEKRTVRFLPRRRRGGRPRRASPSPSRATSGAAPGSASRSSNPVAPPSGRPKSLRAVSAGRTASGWRRPVAVAPTSFTRERHRDGNGAERREARPRGDDRDVLAGKHRELPRLGRVETDPRRSPPAPPGPRGSPARGP